MSHRPEIIAFSVYIWNVEIVKEITSIIKRDTDVIIAWGGPEVSFDEIYFLETNPVDFIVRGEGELAFHQLLHALHTSQTFHHISGLSYRDGENVISNPMTDPIQLDKIHSPFRGESDLLNLRNRINYVETSRGCPFHCSYCLASLDNKVRFFDIERVKKEMLFLMDHGAKTFKFLDRTFNTSYQYSIDIFDFLLKNHQEGMSFQFEITGDILKPEIIQYLNQVSPPHLFRFEIGIQSTNELTNKAVDRIQNNDVLFENIKKIKEGNVIDMHLDLIAGLPYENLSSFEKTFNEVFRLYAKELQLGFLKMLRGTSIRLQAPRYGYEFNPLPPYEIISNDVLSKSDLEIIHHVEDMVEIFWNKGFMNHSIEALTKSIDSPFSMFHDLYAFSTEQGFDLHRYQLEDVFKMIHLFVKTKGLMDESDFLSWLKKDYLLYHNLKPKIWWNKEFENKNILLSKIHSIHPEHKLDDYYKYSVVTQYFDHILVILYFPTGKVYFEWHSEQR